MLPDIRAVIAAIFVTVGLLAGSFGLVAMFRVAQDRHVSSLHADLAQHSRATFAMPLASHANLIIDTPAETVRPALAPDIAAESPSETEAASSVAPELSEPEEIAIASVIVRPEPPPPAPPIEMVAAAAPVVETSTPAGETIAAAPVATPLAAPPVGGPFEPAVHKDVRRDKEKARRVAAHAAKLAAVKLAAAKLVATRRAAAKKARAARLARERRLAAARAAQAPAQVQPRMQDPFASFSDPRRTQVPSVFGDQAGRSSGGP